MNTYLWIDCQKETTPELLAGKLNQIILRCKRRKKSHIQPIVLLCIGTPNIPGDCLGPAVGTLLSGNDSFHVYGTLDHPVHALNLKASLNMIKKNHENPLIIVVDAAIGSEMQSGYLTLKKGSLKPGSGLGKRLPAIGDIQITGVFHNLYGEQAHSQMQKYSYCIAKGLSTFTLSSGYSYNR